MPKTREKKETIWFVVVGDKLVTTFKAPSAMEADEIGLALREQGYPGHALVSPARNELVA